MSERKRIIWLVSILGAPSLALMFAITDEALHSPTLNAAHDWLMRRLAESHAAGLAEHGGEPEEIC